MTISNTKGHFPMLYTPTCGYGCQSFPVEFSYSCSLYGAWSWWTNAAGKSIAFLKSYRQQWICTKLDRLHLRTGPISEGFKLSPLAHYAFTAEGMKKYSEKKEASSIHSLCMFRLLGVKSILLYSKWHIIYFLRIVFNTFTYFLYMALFAYLFILFFSKYSFKL